jgi:antitoxin component YwqK of YwqJK toxin-antitoxin module
MKIAMKPMLKPAITACLILLLAACQQQAEQPKEVLQKFASGEVSRRHHEINGKKEGLMTDYFLDGKVRSERLFKNDVQMGRSVFYYPQGQIKETQFFDEKGWKQGSDSTFFESGKLQMLLGFEDNKKHGYLRKWSANGELIFEAKYERDTLVEVKGKQLKKSGGQAQ